MKSIPVNVGNGRDYNISIGNNILKEIGALAKEQNIGRKIAIITNPEIRKLYSSELENSLEKQGYHVFVFEVPAGEQNKNLGQISNLIDKLVEKRFERNDSILALSGGVIGDMSGFVAASYLRGINFIQVPTSLLAQVDSSVGGKTGVNHPLGKNLIGAFYQPRFVLIDIKTLNTLKAREILCGLAEIVKYGIICDKQLFMFFEKNINEINKHDFEANKEIWQHLIERSCINKASVVSKDEREQNLREILNFGHTVGHAIEAIFEYKKYSHGEAVALGMVAATEIACEMKMIAPELKLRITNLLLDLNFPSKVPGVKVEDIIQKMALDKKVKDGKLRLVLPADLGHVVVRSDIPLKVIKKCLEKIILL
jgi:3-dehydroquinate synthase